MLIILNEGIICIFSDLQWRGIECSKSSIKIKKPSAALFLITHLDLWGHFLSYLPIPRILFWFFTLPRVVSKTTMALLYGKGFKGNPLLLEYGPTARPYARTSVVPSLPISRSHPSPTCHPTPNASYSSHIALAHPQAINVLIWWNTLSFWPSLQDSAWASTSPGRHPPPKCGFGSPPRSSHSLWAVFTLISREYKIHLCACLPLSIRQRGPRRQGWSSVFESSQIINVPKHS